MCNASRLCYYSAKALFTSIASIIGTNNVTILHWIRGIGRYIKECVLLQPIEHAASLDVIEIDELWHYVQKKERKLWVWLAYSRAKKRVIAIETSSRGEKPLRRLWARLERSLPSAACSDKWQVYRKIIPIELLIQSKKYTHNIEAQNSSLRDFIKLFNHKTKAYSKSPEMAELAAYIHFFCKYMIS